MFHVHSVFLYRLDIHEVAGSFPSNLCYNSVRKLGVDGKMLVWGTILWMRCLRSGVRDHLLVSEGADRNCAQSLWLSQFAMFNVGNLDFVPGLWSHAGKSKDPREFPRNSNEIQWDSISCPEIFHTIQTNPYTSLKNIGNHENTGIPWISQLFIKPYGWRRYKHYKCGTYLKEMWRIWLTCGINAKLADSKVELVHKGTPQAKQEPWWL